MTNCPWGLNWMGTVCPGGSILWGLFVQGTGSDGSEVQGSSVLGTKCDAPNTCSKKVKQIQLSILQSHATQKRYVCSNQKCNLVWVANIAELLKSCVQRIKVDFIKNLNSWLSAQVRAKILMNQLKWWVGAAWLTRHTGFIKWLMKRSSTLYRGPPKLEYLPTKNVKRTVKRITL